MRRHAPDQGQAGITSAAGAVAGGGDCPDAANGRAGELGTQEIRKDRPSLNSETHPTEGAEGPRDGIRKANGGNVSALPPGAMELAARMAAPAGRAVLDCQVRTNGQGQVEVKFLLDVAGIPTGAVPAAGGLVELATEQILRQGRLEYRAGFADVWLGGRHFDLRQRKKARFCLEYLIEKEAYDARHARHLVEEIDPYVRQRGDFMPAADIKIDHYFGGGDGNVRELRKALVRSAGDGCYFLQLG